RDWSSDVCSSDLEKEAIKQQLLEEERNKQRYFNQNINKEKTEKIVAQRLNNYIQTLITEDEDISKSVSLSDIYSQWVSTPIGFISSIMLALPMYLLMTIYRFPIVRYIA